MRLPTTLALGGLLLAGCGGVKDVDPDKEPLVDYSHLRPTPVTEQAMVLADAEALDLHIKNGLRLRVGSSGGGGGVDGGGGGWAPVPGSGSSSGSVADNPSSGGSSSSGSPMPGGGAEPPDFTDTNVHVAGVDEADYAKYDGKHWFVATRPHLRDFFEVEQPGIQIATTDPATQQLEVVTHYELNGDWGVAEDMYLVSEQQSTTHLAVIRRQHSYYDYPTPLPPVFTSSSSSTGGGPGATSSSSGAVAGSAPGYYYGPRNGRVRIELINVQDPAAPAQDWAMEMDGEVVDSRRIGDMLYLITRFEPWLANLQPDYGDVASRNANEQALSETPVSQLLPQYDLGAGKQPLTGNCYLQQGTDANMGFTSLVHVTAVNLKTQQMVGSQCVNASVEALSMSLQSLYLTGTAWSDSGHKTVIHKFAFAEAGPEYQASGSVPGTINHNSDPAFRLHEHEDDLRIVTTEWQGDLLHRLFIMSQTGDQLDVVAQLPNSAQPAPIGKPGENIFAVRFEAERAYIVTFQQTDPLYAIDLSDRLAPVIIGELEVPGFATYMHPLNTRYLFTLGRDADESGFVRGIKAELIDVSSDAPVSVGTLLLGSAQTYSEAIHNLRALSLLQVSDDHWRIALPISLFEEGDDRYGVEWRYNGLQLLDISGLEGEGAVLSDAGVIVAESKDAGFDHRYQMSSRGVLHGDAVFFAHNNAFWAAHWDAPEEATGPLASQLVTCSDESVDGIQLELYMSGSRDNTSSCDASVTIRDGDYVELLTGQPLHDSHEYCFFSGAKDRAGDYTLEVTHLGYTSTVQRIDVTQGRCHVRTQSLYLEAHPLDPEICTDVAVPSLSVRLALADSSPGADACSASVVAVQNDMRYELRAWQAELGPVTSSDVCQFTGPFELSGEMALEISLEGYADHVTTDILVPEANCHVETQKLSVELEPSP